MRRLGCFVFGLLLLSCGDGGDASGRGGSRDGRLQVYAVNYPLQYLAGRIGGDLVNAVLPVPRGSDPALWSPPAEIVAEYQAADLILLNGAGYAGWVERVALPQSRIVDTGASFADRLIELEDTITHSHGSEGEHSHTGYAVETWLDPQLARQQARAIAAALEALRPESKAAFEEGLAALEKDLAALDEELHGATAPLHDRLIVFSHPRYEYLIRRYDILAESVHWEPDKAPGHFRWAAFDDKVGDRQPLAVVWEAEPIREAQQAVEERGLASVVFRPVANVPMEGDYLSVMRANALALASLAAADESRESASTGAGAGGEG